MSDSTVFLRIFRHRPMTASTRRQIWDSPFPALDLQKISCSGLAPDSLYGPVRLRGYIRSTKHVQSLLGNHRTGCGDLESTVFVALSIFMCTET